MLFDYDMPSNDQEVINNLQTLNNMKSISLQSILEKSPYIADSVQELERLHNQSVEQDLSTVDNHIDTMGNNE